MSTPSQQAANICQLCYSQGHYDYQCQFAGDFMARTQKAFNQGRSYSHQDPNNGEWSQVEQFSDAGKVANEGDPQLKAAADTELYEIEKRAIQIDTEKHEYNNSSGRTDDINYSQRAENEYLSQRAENDYSSQSA